MALSGRVQDLTAGKGYRLTAAQVPERLREELKQRAAATTSSDGLVRFPFLYRANRRIEAVDLLRAEAMRDRSAPARPPARSKKCS